MHSVAALYLTHHTPTPPAPGLRDPRTVAVAKLADEAAGRTRAAPAGDMLVFAASIVLSAVTGGRNFTRTSATTSDKASNTRRM